MKIFGVNLMVTEETKDFRYFRSTNYGRPYEGREDRQKNVDIKKGDMWIRISNRIEYDRE